ncbi:MAG: dihydroorotate dehydrogenase (quinone) [Ponticaulis sp.]|nr:dihydroorotate dehydrogenase (quinone) [Ponticaulis sp.]|tara:strand:+ start:6209 stop:7288 length:1080 start_codon:yes stop_codon:yes gene_type:complete
MFYSLGQSILKSFDPETAHTLSVRMLKSGLLPAPRISYPPSLAITLPKSGLSLNSPVGLAAGFDKNADVPTQMSKFGFGFVECGTVTPEAQAGNPKPRLFRLTEDRAVINRMGFNNGGLVAFESNLKAYSGSAKLGANVGANKTTEDKVADYVIGLIAVWPLCDYVTINISSPNTPGLRGLQDKGALTDLLTRCEAAKEEASTAWPDLTPRPVFLKLAPDLDETAIDDIVGVLQTAGQWLSGLIISNTTLARPDTLRNAAKGQMGGLSGAPLFESSTEVLRQFARRLNGQFDLIGAGGVGSAEQAYAKIRAGAHAVQLYSALVYDGIGLVDQINRGLDRLLKADGCLHLEDAVGADLEN